MPMIPKFHSPPGFFPNGRCISSCLLNASLGHPMHNSTFKSLKSWFCTPALLLPPWSSAQSRFSCSSHALGGALVLLALTHFPSLWESWLLHLQNAHRFQIPLIHLGHQSFLELSLLHPGAWNKGYRLSSWINHCILFALRPSFTPVLLCWSLLTQQASFHLWKSCTFLNQAVSPVPGNLQNKSQTQDHCVWLLCHLHIISPTLTCHRALRNAL